MKVAFAHWDQRIAPVFDTARQVRVVEAASGEIIRETEEPLVGDPGAHAALRLAQLGVDALVCGAVSKTLHNLVASYGIQVIPFVAGNLREVIGAWLDGTLGSDTYVMPGCFGRGRGHRGSHAGARREKDIMDGLGRAGISGQGGGRGQNHGGKGQGRGRMGDPLAAASGGSCVCPKCGHRESHKRGPRCEKKECPECGSWMTRES
jgi:predicted Fe-Mo cluster-binding NifX family protein